MLALDTPLPDFALPVVGVSDTLSRADLDQRPVLLMVICAHCPFVKHVEPELSRLDRDYSARLQLVGLSSNSLITHPQDGPEQLAEQARHHGWSFPYLLDESKPWPALEAACTRSSICSPRTTQASRRCAIMANSMAAGQQRSGAQWPGPWSGAGCRPGWRHGESRAGRLGGLQ